jgi:hypothetical protein
MHLSYDVFADAFLNKTTEYTFIRIPEENRTVIVDGYMKRALPRFAKVCKHDLTVFDDESRSFSSDIPADAVDEIVDIVSEGMLEQWMKPYVYRQENLENVLNTRDFTTYSPAELLLRIGNAYAKVQRDYTNMIREYSYSHGDLSDLHL